MHTIKHVYYEVLDQPLKKKNIEEINEIQKETHTHTSIYLKGGRKRGKNIKYIELIKK